MHKVHAKEVALLKAKAVFRLLFDAAVVTFISVVSATHMETHAYTVGRMVRFWTMWGCWACALYFFVVFSKQLFLLFSPGQNPPVSPFFRRVVDAFQQLAIGVCASVTAAFWALYFRSPTAVFRVDDDWQPSFMEQLFVTHFEHSLPLLFLVLDCLLFHQGNKHATTYYSFSRWAPLAALSIYSAVAYYDFFCCGIRPYPFMDSWGVSALTVFLVFFVSTVMFVFNPLAYHLRRLL